MRDELRLTKNEIEKYFDSSENEKRIVVITVYNSK